jgi:hypothetical protein
LIDSTSESLLPLSQAADELPRRRRGKKTHISTLYRWATAGCRGVVLESLQFGATRCTSREALQRFFERLTGPGKTEALAGSPASSPLRRRSSARRLRESERAAKLLEKAGA